MDSILQSVKKYVGIHAEYDAFDEDIKMHINTAFAILTQLGVGPEEGFMIEGEDESWDEFITSVTFSMVKTFILLSVRLDFDPPTSSAVLESMKRRIDELTWRLQVESDNTVD